MMSSESKHKQTTATGCHGHAPATISNQLRFSALSIVISSIILLSPIRTVSANNQMQQQQQHHHPHQQQQPPTFNDSNQRESLKRSLNEILIQFLHETGKHNHNNNSHHSLQQQHTQRSQQQRASSKEISCDELSLVVLAQRVLKLNASASAISRLIECQHLENNHHHLLAPLRQQDAQLLDNNTNSDNGPLVASQQRQQSASFSNATPLMGEMEPQFISVQSSPRSAPSELHFGAKLALTLLTATIALVLFATFVDIQSAGTSKATANKLKLITSAQQEKYNSSSSPASSTAQANQLRQHRSPSLSSSCSSSLFCSSNSVASSSAPILANGNNNHQSYRYNATKRQHYELNIQQANQNNDKSSNDYALATNSNLRSNINHSFVDSVADLKLNEQQQQQVTNNNGNSFCWLAMESPADHENDAEENNQILANNQSPQPEHSDNTGPEDFNYIQLIRQIFLAFSLRESVKQIVGHSGGATCDRKEIRPQVDQQSVTVAQECAQHSPSTQTCGQNGVTCVHSQADARAARRQAKVAPTSPVSSESKSVAHQQTRSDGNSHFIGCHRCPIEHHNGSHNHQQQRTTITIEQHQPAEAVDSHPHESIDSLHGLRFLSMIWVIVIHSYNFALRWMFFTNTTTVEGVYKTIASQLLANGSFACDSFFFAAGFLLPYLALAPNSSRGANNPTNDVTPPPQLSEHEQGDKAKAPQREFSSLSNNNSNEDENTQDAKSTCPPFEFCPSCPPSLALEDGLGLSTLNTCCCSSCLSTPETSPPAAAAAVTNQSPHCCCFYFSCCARNTNEQPKRQHQQARGNKTGDSFEQQPGRAAKNSPASPNIDLSFDRVLVNIFHRYVRMMPLMMAIIGLSATLLRYIGDGPAWDDSTMMYDKWCRKNWWVNLLFLHNFVNRENMCLSHSWYSAVDLQLFLVGQLTMYILFKSRRIGLAVLFAFLFGSQLITATLTLLHHLPAVPLVASVSEQAMNLYYGEIYIKPYCRASPYLIGILLAYLMRTTPLGQLRLKKWQVALGWSISLSLFAAILFIMQPAMNGHTPSELQSAAYSALSRPLWACATGWMIFACITKQAGPIGSLLGARCFVPFSRLTYPAFLIHPIVMAVFYGSRQSSFHFSHYLMLYLILGNIVITYASAFILAALFELPLLSIERIVKRRFVN